MRFSPGERRPFAVYVRAKRSSRSRDSRIATRELSSRMEWTGISIWAGSQRPGLHVFDNPWTMRWNTCPTASDTRAPPPVVRHSTKPVAVAAWPANLASLAAKGGRRLEEEAQVVDAGLILEVRLTCCLPISPRRLSAALRHDGGPARLFSYRAPFQASRQRQGRCISFDSPPNKMTASSWVGVSISWGRRRPRRRRPQPSFTEIAPSSPHDRRASFDDLAARAVTLRPTHRGAGSEKKWRRLHTADPAEPVSP